MGTHGSCVPRSSGLPPHCFFTSAHYYTLWGHQQTAIPWMPSGEWNLLLFFPCISVLQRNIYCQDCFTLMSCFLPLLENWLLSCVQLRQLPIRKRRTMKPINGLSSMSTPAKSLPQCGRAAPLKGGLHLNHLIKELLFPNPHSARTRCYTAHFSTLHCGQGLWITFFHVGKHLPLGCLALKCSTQWQYTARSKHIFKIYTPLRAFPCFTC